MSKSCPAVGSIYSFRTAPLSEFAPQTTGRYAALKVLGGDKKRVVLTVLDSIWSKPPSLDDVHACAILREHRFSHTGTLAVWSMNAEWWNLSDLDEMTYLGAVAPSDDELRAAAKHSYFATIHLANRAAEGEWRWANDREAYVAEHERVESQRVAEQKAQEEQLRTRLRGLTWDQLLAETPFERWSPSPPFPPEAFTRAARIVVHDTCRELRALGAKPRKADVCKLLRQCVEWFNEADEQAGGVIETEEREDICAVLEELAYVACQKSLMDEVDEWRTW